MLFKVLKFMEIRVILLWQSHELNDFTITIRPELNLIMLQEELFETNEESDVEVPLLDYQQVKIFLNRFLYF